MLGGLGTAVAAVLVVAAVVLVALPSGAARAAEACPGCALPPQTPEQARAVATKTRADWYREMSSRGRRARRRLHPAHFRSPGTKVFLAKLHTASRRYHFQVVRVHMYRPFQLAPFVIARTAHPKQLSRAMYAIERLLDPQSRRSLRATAWAYEAFYFEARDARGVPAFLAFNYLRGGITGGQWARSEALYPFEHG
jgi:hypothetical protein